MTLNKASSGLDDDNSIYCGIGSFRPKRMQTFAKMKWFVTFYSVTSLVMTSLIAYVMSQITTLEKQFGFSSTVSGLLISCNDLGFMLTMLFVTHVTRRVHIPRVLGVCALCFGLSGLFSTLPFFITDNRLPTVSNASTSAAMAFHKHDLCAAANSSVYDKCGGGGDKGSNSVAGITRNVQNVAAAVIGISMLLQGACKSNRYPYFSTYVDDNVEKSKTPVYIGITVGISALGPAVAFILGGVSNTMYVTLEDVDMTPRDPNWIGAWWLGFLVFGTLGLFVGLPLLFFPSRMRQKNKQLIEEEREIPETALKDVKKLGKDLFKLLTNPVFMCLSLASCSSCFALGGMISFLPKYLEIQFFAPSWKANMMLGGICIVIACLGTILGGSLTSRYKLTAMQCLIGCIISNVVAVALATGGFFIGCPHPQLNMGTITADNETRICCDCQTKDYFPVCGDDGVDYFSPCHAGCTSVSMSFEGFTNCSCVDGPLGTTTPGLCETDCKMLYVYLGMIITTLFAVTLSNMPSFISAIRSIPESEKPLALGVIGFLNNLLGWFPGPVAFGRLVDTTCTQWATTCTGTGNCLLFDMTLFRSRYHLLHLGARALCALFYVLAFVVAKNKQTAFYEESLEIVVPEEEILMKEKENPSVSDNSSTQNEN